MNHTIDELIAAFVTLGRLSEQQDHYKTQPRKGGQFAPHSGGSGGGHKGKSKTKGIETPEVGKPKKSVFDEGQNKEEGGYYKQLPDGGIEWVESGGGEPSPGGGETGGATSPSTQGETITGPDGNQRKAIIEDHNGVRLVTPEDLNTDAQRITTDEVKGFIDQVPTEHRDVFTEVRIMDEPFRDENGRASDTAAATYYPETGVIEIHKNSQFDEETLKTTISRTVRHEGAHALTDRLGDNFVRDWKQAARKDGNSISDYADTDTHEDIAETIANYWSPNPTDRKVVERFFPERYAILKRYGVKPGG